jgi:hypothetical protein
MVAHRAMRLTLENGLSMYLALILTNLSAPLRIKGNFKAACRYGHLVKRIFQRFADREGGIAHRNSDFLLTECILHGGILPLKDHLYSESLETYMDIHRLSLKQGETETGMVSAMLFLLSYFASGMPLNSVLHAKLVLFEEKASQLQQPLFAALFHCSKHVLMNLQGKKKKKSLKESGPSHSLTEIEDEEEVLSKLEAKGRSMTLRDFCIYRLFLACIYGDMECMGKMLERLDSYPLFDLPLVRQYMRLTFGGIAAFLLARKSSSQKRKYLKNGKEIVRYLKKLDIADDKRVGGVNTRPVLLCLKAVEANQFDDYVKAIDACDHARLIHLQAMMSELCGLYCLERHIPCGGVDQSVLSGIDGTSSWQRKYFDLARGYLGRALWLYQDWGAFAKVQALKDQFGFLSQMSRREASVFVSGIHNSTLHVVDEGSISSHRSHRSSTRRTSLSERFGSVSRHRRQRRRSSNGSSSSVSHSQSIDSSSARSSSQNHQDEDESSESDKGILSGFFKIGRRRLCEQNM